VPLPLSGNIARPGHLLPDQIAEKGRAVLRVILLLSFEEPPMIGIGSRSDEHLEVRVHETSSGRKQVIRGYRSKDSRGIFFIDDLQELLHSSEPVRYQARMKLREAEEMSLAKTDNRVMHTKRKEVGKKDRLSYPEAAFGKKIGGKARRALFDLVSAKETGLFTLFDKTLYEGGVTVPEEGLCLVLEIGVIDAGITKEGVLADLKHVAVFCKIPKGIMEPRF
jgi:hypothetical protein